MEASQANSPFRQGKVERRIGIIKHLLWISITDSKSASSKLQLHFLKAANICNSHPIGVHKEVPESGILQILMLNSLLLSRNNGNPGEKIDPELFGSKNHRLEILQTCQDWFWKGWYEEVTPK